MAAPDIPFVDIPATDKLTVRLELSPRGHLALRLFYGGDPNQVLGTDNVFTWDGRWADRRGVLVNGHPPYATDAEILEFVRRKLVWHDLREETVGAFFASGALPAALRDARLHHLALTVMGA